VFVGHAGDARLVGAFESMARVCQPRREIAIVRQQQQPFAVVVEAPDRVDVFAHAAEQIDDR
jgi:hypothetical protein